MTVTKPQAQMLTTLAIACRPNGARRWDSAGVMAALAKVADRSLPEVVLAVIRAAADRDVDSPGVIPSAGSHWAESAGVRPLVLDTAPLGTRCTVCGRTEERHGEDHGFALPKPPPDPETVAAHVAKLKAQLEPTSGPTERRTLEDLAAANPRLHERVEAVRAGLPGVQAPAMREPEDETTAEETADV